MRACPTRPANEQTHQPPNGKPWTHQPQGRSLLPPGVGARLPEVPSLPHPPARSSAERPRPQRWNPGRRRGCRTPPPRRVCLLGPGGGRTSTVDAVGEGERRGGSSIGGAHEVKASGGAVASQPCTAAPSPQHAGAARKPVSSPVIGHAPPGAAAIWDVVGGPAVGETGTSRGAVGAGSEGCGAMHCSTGPLATSRDAMRSCNKGDAGQRRRAGG